MSAWTPSPKSWRTSRSGRNLDRHRNAARQARAAVRPALPATPARLHRHQDHQSHLEKRMNPHDQILKNLVAIKHLLNAVDLNKCDTQDLLAISDAIHNRLES